MNGLVRLARILGEGRDVDLVGARGSSAERAAVEVHLRTSRRVVWVAPDASAARRAFADLTHLHAALTGGVPGDVDRPESVETVLLHPPTLHSPYSDVIPDRARQQARMTTLFRIAMDFPWAYLVVVPQTLVVRVAPVDTIVDRSDLLRTGMELDRDALVRLLSGSGYHRLPVVEAPGTFAVRGELLDVWPPSQAEPVRVELLWDQIERIRHFDPQTQRTTTEIREVFVHPTMEVPTDPEARERAADRVLELCDARNVPTRRARAIAQEIREQRNLFSLNRFVPAFHGRMPCLLDVIEESSVVFVEEPDEVLASARRIRRGLEDDFERLGASGEPAFEPDALSRGIEKVEERLRTKPSVFVHPPALPPEEREGAEVVDLDAEDHLLLSHSVRSTDGKVVEGGPRVGSLAPFVAAIRKWLSQGLRVTLVAPTAGGVERLVDLVRGYGLVAATEPGGPLTVVLGPLTRGYQLLDTGEVLVSDQEIFGPRIRKRARTSGPRHEIEDLRSLVPGDHVVHKVHGVGRFEGLVTRQHDQVMLELIKVSYRDGDILYVPVTSLDQVQKFTGGTPSRLDRLGGESFARVKEKTRKAVVELADRLLELYATRKAVPGRALAARDRDYREFEAMFPFEETPDQERAIEKVMDDLERDTPMDRLLCGDVGFGKTEVAIRAAYRVAMAGRQVAVLVPTTVLAQQHMATFRQRLSGTALSVAGLSRFVSSAERREIVSGLKAGKIDIVIGTHRLLSRDVHFADLGLLVIDEEHRFGVAQKERIKFLAPGTDVLHMTATPIPRTLQMSMGDILELSIISTPPAERLSVDTHVVRRNDAVIRDAVIRELARGGQVFFVHNRVQTIEKVAEHLRDLVPGARMAVGHGQMGETELEKVMLDFVSGRVDVLVCTSIIESGLDIPNANTVLVDDAHTFGLAQLYQIRGRVGRASEQAHAYLIVPRPGSMSREAAERIDTLVRFTELGSGFNVATMDLEIRGAGDLLGAEQSGHVRAVGFDLYCEMLREAVEELRGLEPSTRPEPELSLDVSAYIPQEYVEDPGQRMMLYKRMASATDEHEVHDTVVEMRDRFGVLPDKVRDLGRVMQLKVLLRRLGALGLEMSGRRLKLHIGEATSLDPDRLVALIGAGGGATTLTPGMKLVHTMDPGAKDRLAGARIFLESLLATAFAHGLRIS